MTFAAALTSEFLNAFAATATADEAVTIPAADDPRREIVVTLDFVRFVHAVEPTAFGRYSECALCTAEANDWFASDAVATTTHIDGLVVFA